MALSVCRRISTGDTADTSVTLQVLKSRAVRGDGSPLVPGDLITWDYGPHGLDLTCRVVARRIRAGAASDMLEVIRERGAFPRPYVPAVDDREPYVPVPPLDVVNHRFWFLPSGFGGGRQIACLVDRPAAQNIATKLHLSAAGAAPWEEILTARNFAAKGTLDAGGLTAVAATVRIATTSLDFARLQAQSALAQADDTLLLLIGDELLSVGSIAVVSAGVYDLGILRGRQGSTAAVHAGGAATWLFYYSEIETVTHLEFYQVRLAGVYDAGTATKHFKLQAVSPDSTNNAAPGDPGISFTLPDLTEADSAGTRTFRSAIAPVGDLRVGDLWFQTSAGNVVGSYRWSGSAWVDVSDSRIVDNDAAVRALIAEVNRDVAQMIAGTNDHANALLQEALQRTAADVAETATRAAAIIAEAAARTGADTAETAARIAAVSTEQTERITNDAALASDIAAMIAIFNDSTAALIQEFSVRVTAISAETTARTAAVATLTTSIGTVSSALTTESTTRAAADTAETSARTAADSAMTTSIGTVAAGLATELTTRATAVEALASDLAAMIAVFNDSIASLAREYSVRAAADTSMASSITSLNASVGTLNSSVNILAAAYISGGVAVAMAGWALDVNGRATSLKLITASGPVTVANLVLSACDIMTENFVAGTSGWRIRYNGDAEFQNAIVRGTIKVGSTIEAGVAGVGVFGATDAVDTITSGSFVDTGVSQAITSDGGIRTIIISGNVEGDPTTTRTIELKLVRVIGGTSTDVGQTYSMPIAPGAFIYPGWGVSDTPAAGSVTYKIQARITGGSGALATDLNIIIR